METLGLLRSKVMTGGWSSPGYKDFRDFAPEIRHLDGEGFPFLMRLIFDELSLELPGLFGPVGLEELLPVSVAMWRDAVKTLEAKEELSEEDRRGLWQDDTLLGWVYQFWNDPDREALDAKVNAKGKIENHELASKTQLFTDRYMVEWLLQNSLGQHWFAVCQKNSSGTLDNLEARRAEFREKRERGEVSLEALMPIENELEERWKYWVPRDLSTDGLENIPPTLREMKLLDPACGSGHFLVIAFDLLFALYEEEARHRGESWSAEQIACWILENNLHGMDIDGRAVQIAGAALWLKMKRVAPRAKPERMSLVATDFGLKGLTGDEPEIRAFLAQLEEETGIPGHLLDDLIQALKDADHLGSLLRIDKVLDKATKAVQGTLFDSGNLQETLTKRLADFVRAHADEQDLGVKLRQGSS